MENNHTLIANGFRTLLGAFAPYIARELLNEHGKEWWDKAVLNTLYEDQRRDLPLSGDWGLLVDSLDIQRCLLLFDLHWSTVFKKKLSIDHRTWAKELVGVRNKWAHIGGVDFSNDDTWRALDTMSRLCDQLDSENAEDIRKLYRSLRYGTTGGSTDITQTSTQPVKPKNGKHAAVIQPIPYSGLPGWRDCIEPHPDVAQGRYKNAEFAADLAQVARGEGAFEYLDPVEFFARTYVTEGMSGLLAQSLRRITGKDGEPVIQLKTAFGGGKTHSMLALYHMLKGRISIDKIPNVKPVLAAAKVLALPKANIAVLVGTALDPSKSKRPQYMPGITINTLWGEMAAQLAEASGKPKVYDYVKEADRKGVSPGSEALKNLFNACSPCLILMDEIVAYAKKLYGAKDLPAGTFDNLISFIHELTEAARASKNSIVVASIPESDIEIGGEAGKVALATIEHTFGRMEAIWKPVAANEGFEVVRRRLFLDCKNPAARDLVCGKFSKMYGENAGEFPFETKELSYLERMKSCYPIHPEVFDRLYEDWATLERFQRTRGVLRLMAAVIHELWMGNDASMMIMPGSIPMDVPNVRDELTRHLPDGWNALVDREVDGASSIPYQKDKINPRFGRNLAARRVARTIMLGSAPSVRDQNIRGIEASRIRLGVVQPGEHISDFNDARSSLQSSLTYLYTNSSESRFWYDTRPTLRKMVEDRAAQIVTSDVEHEIEQRLRKLRKEPPFAGVHVCPNSSLDVPDEMSARLVILGSKDTYNAADQNNAALKAVKDILADRGTIPRIYRNMLVFLVPDQDNLVSLKQEVKRLKAWESIKEDRESLNLDATQNKETDENIKRSNETIDARIKETYCWLLLPYIDLDSNLNSIEWERIRISGGSDSIVTKAAKRILQNEAIISKWAPMLLMLQLNKLLWKNADHIEIKKLWEYLCTYCYLPRLENEKVLEDAICKGVNSTEYFAYASGFDGSRYIDLKYNKHIGAVERSGYLVKVDVASKQIADDEKRRKAADEAQGVITPGINGSGISGTGTVYPDNITDVTGIEATATNETTLPPTTKKPTRFYMSAPLDITRIGRDVQKLVDEVIFHLQTIDDASLEVVLELKATVPDGISQSVVRTVSENCTTLKIKSFGFEES